MTQTEFKKRCYELYQLDWMKTHGYSLQDAFNVLREGYAEGCASGNIDGSTGCVDDFDVMEEYFGEQGFNGNLFACEEEFYDCEYQDAAYMEYLLSADMLKQYNHEKKEIEMKDNSSQIVEDIKCILFDDRDYDSFTQFETWIGDGHSFIIKDDDGQEYRVTVTREME